MTHDVMQNGITGRRNFTTFKQRGAGRRTDIRERKRDLASDLGRTSRESTPKAVPTEKIAQKMLAIT